MLAPLRRQNLNPPPGHANRPAQILSAGRPCWRLAAGKALSHHLATPTGRPKSRLPAVYVGAASLAKPYATVGPRQQGAPNPACRPPMLAPLRWQIPISPPDHANRPAQIPPAGRPCWRLPAGKALSHRRAMPTGRPESRLPTVHVGAPSPSKPYATVWPRQQAAPNPACRLSMLALPRWKNLTPPLDHANSPAQNPPACRPCWRPSAGKALSHRRATPTVRPKPRPAAAHVGAPPPTKPYPTA